MTGLDRHRPEAVHPRGGAHAGEGRVVPDTRRGHGLTGRDVILPPGQPSGRRSPPGAGPPPADPVSVIAALFTTDSGHGRPGAVSPAAHMLQAAALAGRAGATPAMLAATLLHDVGRLTGPRRVRALEPGADNGHGDTGADWLARWFGEEVTGPVRLHVAAKRYLCAAEPGYVQALPEASARALAAQGGPMRPGEMAAFEAQPHAYAALRLRHWDDEAKDPVAAAPAFGYYQPLLRRLISAR